MLTQEPSRRVIAEPMRAAIAAPAGNDHDQRRTTPEPAPAPRFGPSRPEAPVPTTA
jgi:hypothetical protein